jgi:short subunit dehydrogenase-like uncharacterized protein
MFKLSKNRIRHGSNTSSSSSSSSSSENEDTKELDLVIFGATGFTGNFVVQEVVKTLPQIESQLRRSLRWGVAGRSEGRLKQVVAKVEQLNPQTRPPTILVADVTSHDSIHELARRTKVVISCVGPYRLYGEPLVKACIHHGTSYVDITGETGFILNSIFRHNEKARHSDVAIVHACGYDSVPAEMGVLYGTRLLEAKNAIPSSIEIFYTFTGGSFGAQLNTGTYASAIHEMGHMYEIFSLVHALEQKYPVEYVGPSIESWLPIRYDSRTQSLKIPYLLSDGVILHISQCLLQEQREASKAASMKRPNPIEKITSVFKSLSSSSSPLSSLLSAIQSDSDTEEKDDNKGKRPRRRRGRLAPPSPVQCGTYLEFPLYAFPFAIIILLWIGFIAVASQIPLLRRILISQPRLFTAGMVSPKGPDLDTIEKSGFRQHMFIQGYTQPKEATSQTTENTELTTPLAATKCKPDIQLEVQVSGPNPGYKATATCLVQCAYVLLDRKQRLLIPNGVMTPGVAFWNTDLLDRLQKNGFNYVLLDNE